MKDSAEIEVNFKPFLPLKSQNCYKKSFLAFCIKNSHHILFIKRMYDWTDLRICLEEQEMMENDFFLLTTTGFW